MKRIILLLLALAFAASAAAQEEPCRLTDTTVMAGNTRFRVQRLATSAFDTLSAAHYVRPSEPVMEMDEVKELLGPEFSLDYYLLSYDDGNDELGNYDYSLTELRREGKFRLFVSESDGFGGYYPKERIMKYCGGHCSDQAFFVDTGEEAWNPYYSAVPDGGRFRLTGLHDGQDAVDYRIEYRADDGNFRLLAMLRDVTQQIPVSEIGYTYYIYEPFWVDGTLYFYTEMYPGHSPYIAVTPIVP